MNVDPCILYVNKAPALVLNKTSTLYMNKAPAQDDPRRLDAMNALDALDALDAPGREKSPCNMDMHY